MTKTTLSINGMHCQSCAKIISMELEDLPGVEKVEVFYKDKSSVVQYDPEKISVEKMISIIKELGYEAKEI